MGDSAEAGEQPESSNRSVRKAVRLLRELANHPRSGATATALARATGLTRPTTFRLLHSLQQEGLVERLDTTYVLGWELARLGRHADPYAGLVARAQPLLEGLAEKFDESVTLSVPNPQGGIDLVAEASGSRVVGVIARNMIGERYPLHASSTGKVLLAEQEPRSVVRALPETLEAFTPSTIVDREVLQRELAQVREQGFAIIDNELEDGLLALSRPVRDGAGALVAVLTLNGPRNRFGREQIPEALFEMQKTVDELTAQLWSGRDT